MTKNFLKMLLILNFSTINSLDCETIHKVRNNVQIVNFDLEQELWMQEGACVFADPDLFFSWFVYESTETSC